MNTSIKKLLAGVEPVGIHRAYYYSPAALYAIFNLIDGYSVYVQYISGVNTGSTTYLTFWLGREGDVLA